MTQKVDPRTTRGLNYYDLDTNFQAFLRRIDPDLFARQNDFFQDFAAWCSTTLDEQAEYSDQVDPPKLLEPMIEPGKREKVLGLNPLYRDTLAGIHQRGITGWSFGENREPHLMGFSMEYFAAHSDISTGCPAAMTHSIAYILEKYGDPAVVARFLPHLIRRDSHVKTGSTAVTEKDSGSDAANTKVLAHAQPDGTYKLSGEKAFVSNASFGMSFVLARKVDLDSKIIPGPEGLGVYIMPQCIDEDWTIPNTYKITGLKDKIGTRGLATVELDLNNAYAIELVGPPHGLRVMMEALGCSRVYNAMAAAGAMHRVFLEAKNWADYRIIKGEKLVERPMTKKILIKQAVNWMAASSLAFEAAHSFDACQNGSLEDTAWMRMVTAIAKHRTAELGVEAGMAVLGLFGGNGITADWAISRIVRDMMILPVWEGPTQIQALELVRIVQGSAKGGELFLQRLQNITSNLSSDLMGGKIDDLKTHFDYLRAHPDMAEYLADDLLQHASNVLIYALMCREAGWELLNDQNPTKLIAAQRFNALHFGPRNVLVEPDLPQLSEEFNALVRGIIPKMPQHMMAAGSPAPIP